MDIRVRTEDLAYILVMEGRWDAFTAPEFEASCRELIERGEAGNIILDMTGVDFVSSFGLRGLLQLGKQLEPSGGAVFVVGLQPTVSKVFIGSGFATLFPEYPSLEAALAALEAQAGKKG